MSLFFFKALNSIEPGRRDLTQFLLQRLQREHTALELGWRKEHLRHLSELNADELRPAFMK